MALKDVYGHESAIDESKVETDIINDRLLAKKMIARIATLSQEKAYLVWRIKAIP